MLAHVRSACAVIVPCPPARLSRAVRRSSAGVRGRLVAGARTVVVAVVAIGDLQGQQGAGCGDQTIAGSYTRQANNAGNHTHRLFCWPAPARVPVWHNWERDGPLESHAFRLLEEQDRNGERFDREDTAQLTAMRSGLPEVRPALCRAGYADG